MSWLNITRNIDDYHEEAIGWLTAQNDLWAITTSGSAPDTIARLRRKTNADGSSQAWRSIHTDLPVAVEYGITGFAEDTEYNRLYIANGPSGEVFYNITGDPQDDWDKLLHKTYGAFQGAAGNIQDLIFYNKRVYLAHKGGVSALNTLTRRWSVVGDFTEGFDGVGQCNDFYVLNNELYVTVAFGDLGAVFKYNADTHSLNWTKVAELPITSTHPEYLAARNNILFCTDAGTGQNIFNSEGIDTTLTGQPRFTQGTHLSGIPSSMHTYSADNFIYVACENGGSTEAAADAHTDNLITSVRQLIPGTAESGETFINAVTGEELNDYTTYTFKNNEQVFSTTPDNTLLKIEFAAQTNALEFLPGETYTVVWEYGFLCSATAFTSFGFLRAGGTSALKVGFKSNEGTGRDGNSPVATYTNNLETTFDVPTTRYTFTFNADDVASTTDGEFRIEGHVAALVKAALRWNEDWHFLANARIKNFKIYRGDASIANSQFIAPEYILKEYANIPSVEKGNHSIGAPSPPDQWFIKFPAGGTPSFSPTKSSSPGSAAGAPLLLPPGPGGGGFGDLTLPPTDPPDPPPTDPLEPPPTDPPDPPPTDPTDPTDPPDPLLPDDPSLPGDPADDDIDSGGDTIIVTAGTTGEFARRLLVTNRIDLQSGEIYRFHMIINRINNPNAGKNVLHVRIQSSLAALRPAFDGTYSSTGVQSPIEWEIDTTGIAQEDLLGIRFCINIFEEDTEITDAATVYISDINILGKISAIPINTLYRYDGELWDNSIAQVSTDGGITDNGASNLVESYEVNSNAQRLYCICNGNIYVWSIGENDPYGGTTASRIVVSW